MTHEVEMNQAKAALEARTAPAATLIETVFTLSYDLTEVRMIPVDHPTATDIRLIPNTARVTLDIDAAGIASPVYLELEGTQVMDEVGVYPEPIAAGYDLEVPAHLELLPPYLLRVLAQATETAMSWGRASAS